MQNTPDFSYLNEVSNGDYIVMMEFIAIFKEQLPTFIKDFNKAISEKNYNKVAAIAHKAKSTVSIFGMHDWALKMKQIELDINQNIIPNNLEQIMIDFENDSKETIEKATIYAEKNK